MTNYLRFFTLLIAISLIGCGAAIPTIKPYKMDIQQGNVVTSEMLLKLRPGMSKSQVKFIMGTPLLVDSFRTNRWDYFYQLRKQGKVVNQRRVILDFEEDALKRVRGDVVPKGQTAEDVANQVKQESGQDVKSAGDRVEQESLEASAPIVTAVEDAPVIDAVDQSLDAAADAAPASVLAVPLAVEPVAIPSGSALPAEKSAEAVADVAEPLSPAIEAPEVSSAAAVGKEVLAPVEAGAVEAVEEKIAPVVPEPVAVPKADIVKETPVPETLPVVKETPVTIKEKAIEPRRKVLTIVPPKAATNKKVFRMDRSLDTTRIVAGEGVAPTPQHNSVVKEVSESEGDVSEGGEPGFFERALEKIGF